jgi:hypothetical protein
VRAKITVRSVVVTVFEIGNDTGDSPREFQKLVERSQYPVSLNNSSWYPIALKPVQNIGFHCEVWSR